MNRDKKYRNIAICAGLFFGFFLLYLFTLAPGVMWGDSAKLVMLAAKPSFEVQAAHHPLHNYVGWVFTHLPVGDAAFRINLMSAFFGALAIVGTFLVCLRLSGGLFASILAACALGISHTFWLLSVMAESYTLTLCLLAWSFYFTWIYDVTGKPFYLFLSFVLFGMACSANMAAAMLLPGLIFHIASGRKKHRTGSTLVFALIGITAGLIPIITNFIICLETRSPGRLIADAFAFDYMVGMFWNEPSTALKGLGLFIAWLFYQLPLLGFAAALAGFASAWKNNRRLAVTILVMTGTIVLFTSTFMLQRRVMILSLNMIPLAFLVAFGFKEMLKLLDSSLKSPLVTRFLLIGIVVVIPPICYYIAPGAAENTIADKVEIRSLPERDNLSWFLSPWKHGERGPGIFARAAFMEAGDGIIIADATPMRALMYFKRFGDMDSTAKLVPLEGIVLYDYLEKQVGGKEVYMVENPDFYANMYIFKSKYRIEKAGPLFRISSK